MTILKLKRGKRGSIMGFKIITILESYFDKKRGAQFLVDCDGEIMNISVDKLLSCIEDYSYAKV